MFAAVLAATLLVPSMLEGQTTARVEARLRIAEVLMLDVEPGDAAVVATADGYTEADGAVVLHVRANRAWKVTASGTGATRVASTRVAADPQPRLWWRVSSSSAGVRAQTAGYTEVESAERVVVTGGPGEVRVELDYRWLGGESPPRLVYTISSN